VKVLIIHVKMEEKKVIARMFVSPYLSLGSKCLMHEDLRGSEATLSLGSELGIHDHSP